MEKIPLEQKLLVQALHLFEMPKTLYLQDKPAPSSNGVHVEGTCENLENINGMSMASCAFVGCVSALESTDIFVILQMVKLLILHT